MGLYEREGDQFELFDPSVGHWPHRLEVLTPPPLRTLRIECVDCGTAVELPFDTNRQVAGQIGMWLEGWRRDPATSQDRCPWCVEEETAC